MSRDPNFSRSDPEPDTSAKSGLRSYLIKRGASGEGAIGTESTGENFVVELAGIMLPCGMPALELLHCFSWSEIQAI